LTSDEASGDVYDSGRLIRKEHSVPLNKMTEGRQNLSGR